MRALGTDIASTNVLRWQASRYVLRRAKSPVWPEEE